MLGIFMFHWIFTVFALIWRIVVASCTETQRRVNARMKHSDGDRTSSEDDIETAVKSTLEETVEIGEHLSSLRNEFGDIKVSLDDHLRLMGRSRDEDVLKLQKDLVRSFREAVQKLQEKQERKALDVPEQKSQTIFDSDSFAAVVEMNAVKRQTSASAESTCASSSEQTEQLRKEIERLNHMSQEIAERHLVAIEQLSDDRHAHPIVQLCQEVQQMSERFKRKDGSDRQIQQSVFCFLEEVQRLNERLKVQEETNSRIAREDSTKSLYNEENFRLRVEADCLKRENKSLEDGYQSLLDLIAKQDGNLSPTTPTAPVTVYGNRSRTTSPQPHNHMKMRQCCYTFDAA
jgi:hypothetical protein